jgi:hypothetical protein
MRNVGVTNVAIVESEVITPRNHRLSTRLLGSVSFAALVTLLVVRHDVEPATIPGFLVATLVVYLAWPAYTARLPPGYTWPVRPSGIITVLLLNLVLVVASLLLRGEPVVVTTVAPRLALMVPATFAIAVGASVMHALRWPSTGPS